MTPSPHHVSQFPESPWSILPPDVRDNWQQHADHEADIVFQNFAHPRNLGCVQRFLQQLAPTGRWLVYGAGSHTQRLLPLLRRFTDLTIVGLVDRMAGQLGTQFGLPVVTPAQARDLAVDGVLLSHTCREWDMAAALREVGFPAEKIIPIYSHPLYAAACAPWYDDLAERVPDGVTQLVVRCGRSTVIDDAHLAESFDPASTLTIFAGRADYFERSTLYRQIDVAQSLTALQKIIRLSGAKRIYLSTGWFNNQLALVLYRHFPKLTIIHEIFDWNVLFPAGTTVAAFGHHPATIQRNLLGEYVGLQRAAAVVSKRDGHYWQRVTAAGTQPYLAFHSGYQDSAPTPVTRAESGFHLVYGGILPDPAFLANYQIDYDFLPLFESLCRFPEITISLYNSLDDGNPRFKPYHERFANGSLRYHPRLPYARFLAQAAGADYGWQAVISRREFAPDQICVLPSRAMGYLAAGLPLILDPGWHFLAELVQQFDAGLILEDFEPEAVRQQLHAAPRAQHAQGAAKLYQWIGRHNRATLARLAQC